MAAPLIPPRFHRVWFGPRSIPPVYVQYGESWVKHNPGWHLHTWGYDDLPPLINQQVFDACGDTWQPNPGGGKQSSAQAVQRADIASYEILYQHGGIYLNCDMEARRPLGDLLDGVDCFLVIEQGDFPSNAVMGATKQHPFFRHVIDLLPRRVADHRGDEMNVQTGPHLLRAALKSWDGPAPTIFGPELFMPFLYGDMARRHDDFPDAYAVHHWGHQVPDDELWG